MIHETELCPKNMRSTGESKAGVGARQALVG